MKFLFLALLPPLLLASSVVHAAWPDFIQTDSDWEYLYNTGYIDYNTYQLYREVAEGISISDTTAYVIERSGNPMPEITGQVLSGTKPADSSVSSSPDSASDLLPRVGMRTGQKIQEGRNSGYLFGSSASRFFSFQFKGRQDNGIWRPERRALDFANGYLNVTVGNYCAWVGAGLIIGQFDHRPVSYECEMSLGEELLCPDNSYYNGLTIEFRKNIGLLYSGKRYDGVSKGVMGGWGSRSWAGLNLGMALCATRLSRGGDQRTMGAGSVFVADASVGVQCEVGYAESGAGACLRLTRQGYDIRLWHYDASFLNLQSSAPAHADYIPYHDDRLELSFRQPQAGESGLFLSKHLTEGKLDMTGATEIWKKAPGERIASDNSILGRYHLSESLALSARYSEKPMPSGRRALAECGARLCGNFDAMFFVSLWVQRERVLCSRSVYFINASFPLMARQSRIGGRLRWNLDGEFDYFIETSTWVYRNVFLKGTYRWQHSYGNRLGPLYIVMESSL